MGIGVEIERVTFNAHPLPFIKTLYKKKKPDLIDMGLP